MKSLRIESLEDRIAPGRMSWGGGKSNDSRSKGSKSSGSGKSKDSRSAKSHGSNGKHK